MATHHAVGAHLVGGLKVPDAATAMRAAAAILGAHLYAVTDGETGERNHWVQWQVGKLVAVEGIEPVDVRGGVYGAGFTTLAVDSSVTALPPRCLGYADAAAGSYLVFRRLREQGVIPVGVKFQVSLPTPYATVALFVREADQERFHPVYEAAIAHEVAAIVGIVDPGDLVVQYDVAVEIGVLCGVFAATRALQGKRFIIDALTRALATVPSGVIRGLHLGYGDLQHRHFVVPTDLSLCVELANGVGAGADFVHMPADSATGLRPEYYRPVWDLTMPRLALGVIDYDGDEARTAQLLDASATGGGRDFAVATECGMARIDERGVPGPGLERLLTLHAKFAVPIR